MAPGPQAKQRKMLSVHIFLRLGSHTISKPAGSTTAVALAFVPPSHKPLLRTPLMLSAHFLEPTAVCTSQGNTVTVHLQLPFLLSCPSIPCTTAVLHPFLFPGVAWRGCGLQWSNTARWTSASRRKSYCKATRECKESCAKPSH